MRAENEKPDNYQVSNVKQADYFIVSSLVRGWPNSRKYNGEEK